MEFEKLVIPQHYNHLLQAIILNWLNDRVYATFLHDYGYTFKSRRYKMYTFSSLYGNFERDRVSGKLVYKDGARFTVACVDDKFIEYIAKNIIFSEKVYFYNQRVEIVDVELSDVGIRDKARVVTRSPVTVYSTIQVDGKKWTKYYKPSDEKFIKLLKENLLRKYEAYYQKQPQETIIIRHIGYHPKKAVIDYKGTIINAWKTVFELEGDPELIKLAFDSGLGSKNSMGFGCIGLI